MVVARHGWLLLMVFLWVAAAGADTVRVRFPEATTRGFLAVRTPDGALIGHGELRQRARGVEIDSRLTLRFKDGSLHDESTTYSQRGAFRLEAYSLTQRGPAFPGAEIAFDRKSGRYRAKTRERPDGPEETASGELEMPADLYNGMALVLLKNLAPGATVSARIAAFTPKPRLITMDLSHEGNDAVRIGPATKTARRHLVKLEVGGLTGIVATLIGKDPPDLRYWLVAGDVPAFVRFQGAMYLNGPVWRLEMAPVEWP